MIAKWAHFWMQLHASGLQQDAVIEIMLAILGGMIAILALISAVGAVAVSVVGWFGYQTIRDEARHRAEEIATNVATSTATKIANDTLNQMWLQVQASGLSEGQAEAEISPDVDASTLDRPKRTRRRATTDRNLKEGGQA